MRQGLNHFKGFLHHFVLAKLATSSIRVECDTPQGGRHNLISRGNIVALTMSTDDISLKGYQFFMIQREISMYHISYPNSFVMIPRSFVSFATTRVFQVLEQAG